MSKSLIPFTADQFVPGNILDYFGHVCVESAPRAQIKARATDFQVEEEQDKLKYLCTGSSTPRELKMLCSVSADSDLPENLDFPKTERLTAADSGVRDHRRGIDLLVAVHDHLVKGIGFGLRNRQERRRNHCCQKQKRYEGRAQHPLGKSLARQCCACRSPHEPPPRCTISCVPD